MIYRQGDSLPGYGDEATWPPCTGHPNDPRSEPDEEPPVDEWEPIVQDDLDDAAPEPEPERF